MRTTPSLPTVFAANFVCGITGIAPSLLLVQLAPSFRDKSSFIGALDKSAVTLGSTLGIIYASNHLALTVFGRWQRSQNFWRPLAPLLSGSTVGASLGGAFAGMAALTHAIWARQL